MIIYLFFDFKQRKIDDVSLKEKFLVHPDLYKLIWF